MTVSTPTSLPSGAAPAKAAADSSREALRCATEAAHARLHLHPSFAGLQHGVLSEAAYARLLLRLLGLHEPVERRLTQHNAAPWMTWRPATEGALRTTNLRRDLTVLGLSAAEISAAPRADALLPALNNAPTALGCAWVVEGSALGGQVLARSLSSILGDQTAGAKSFFVGGSHIAQRWRGLCEAVERCGSDPMNRATMLAAAVATFDSFELWLRDLT